MLDAIQQARSLKSLEGVLAGGRESDSGSGGSLVGGRSEEYLAARGRRHAVCGDVHR
jgi:hypothetical protein